MSNAIIIKNQVSIAQFKIIGCITIVNDLQ